MNFVKRSSVTAIAGLAIAAGASAALAATPTFPAYTGPPSKTNPVVKPTEIVYTGDGSGFFAGIKGSKKIGKLKWATWNGNEGLGTGYNWIDNCSPSCAAGTFSRYPVRLKVFKPKQVSKKYYIFTRLTVTYTGEKPEKKRTFTWPVTFSRGAFLIG